MKGRIKKSDAKVDRIRSLPVAPPVDQQRDQPTELSIPSTLKADGEPLMDLSERRAMVINFDLPWDQSRKPGR